MATITKDAEQSGIPITLITHAGSPNWVKGTEIATTTDLSATCVMYHSSVEATANTNPGTFYVMTNPFDSGGDGWAVHSSFTASATTASDQVLAGTETAGQTVLGIASTTGFVAGDKIYIQDANTISAGEWHRVVAVASNVSLTIADGLEVLKDTSDTIWNDVDTFTAQIDCSAVVRVRVDFQHFGATGANVHVYALWVTGDSIG